MLRTWPVRLLAIWFTESVRSFHTPPTLYFCLAAQFTFRTYFTRHTSYLGREGVQLVNHRIDRVL